MQPLYSPKYLTPLTDWSLRSCDAAAAGGRLGLKAGAVGRLHGSVGFRVSALGFRVGCLNKVYIESVGKFEL